MSKSTPIFYENLNKPFTYNGRTGNIIKEKRGYVWVEFTTKKGKHVHRFCKYN